MGKETATMEGGAPRFNARKYQVLTLGSDGVARTWSADGEKRCEIRTEEGITDCHFSPSGDWVVTRSRSGAVDLWTSTGFHHIRFETREPVSLARFSPAGHSLLFLYAGPTSTRMELRDLDGEILWAAGGLSNLASLESRVSFSPDGEFVALLMDDPVVDLRRLSGGVVRRLTGHEGGINDAMFLARSKGLVTAGQDGTVRLWSLDGKELTRLRGIRGITWEVDGSPDGEYVLTTGDGFAAQLWHRTGRLIRTFELGGRHFAHARFSRSGRHVFTVLGLGAVWSWPVDPEEILDWVNEKKALGLVADLDQSARVRFGLAE